MKNTKILLICYVTPCTLKKQAVCPYETLATIYKTALCYCTEEIKQRSDVIRFVTSGLEIVVREK